MTSILAIVLTCDAPEELAGALATVQNQEKPPKRILVVDNGPGIPVEPRSGVEVERPPSNLGPAGGHAWGLRRFLESDEQAVWIMDDDCRPAPDALRRLSADLERSPDAIVLPAWHQVREGRVVHVPAWSGVLLGRSTVERLGLPRPELIWWTEDTEYLWHRPKVLGVQHVHSEAIVYHRQARRGRSKPVWKIYYEVRNTVWFRTRVQHGYGRRWYRLARGLAAGFRDAARAGALGWRALGLGLLDGALGRLGPRWQIGASTHRSRP